MKLIVELTENWARNVLKAMNWTKRKGTTGKVEPSKKFLVEEKFTFQRKMLYWIMMSRQFLFLIYTRLPFLMSLRGSIYFHQRGQKIFSLKSLMTKGN